MKMLVVLTILIGDSIMNLRDFRSVLAANESVSLHIMLPSGEFVPDHFHVTEVGRVSKTFVDCGGICREYNACSLQVWTAHDVEHRLQSTKLSKIIEIANPLLGRDDIAVEIEYGEEVASTYYLSNIEVTPNGLILVLKGKQTDCLAPDKCGVNKCKAGSCC